MIHDVSSEFVKKNTASRRGLSAPTNQKPPLEPVRKSLRLQKIDADTGLSLPEKEPTRYFVPDEDPQRPPLTDLTLEDLCNNNEDCQTTADYFKQQVNPFISKKTGKSKDYQNLERSLKALKITPERVAKVVPNRIFSLAIHPTEDKLLVAAGGKWGSIGFWDVQDLNSPTHGVQVIKVCLIERIQQKLILFLFQHHSRPVNCMTFDKFDTSKLISTSYDGSCRIFDINSQKSSVIFGVADDDSAYTTYHSQIDKDCFLVTQGRSGFVGLIDKRVSHLKPTLNIKVFEKASPKMVSVHPTKSEYFVSPSSKGDCDIFDIRSGKKSASVMKLIGHTKAISSALFSPQNGNRVVTVSYDNKIRLFDTSDLKAQILKPYKNVAHNNQTGRWLTTFKAEWHPSRDDIFTVGSMNQPRQMDVFNDQGQQLAALKGEDLASVCSIVKLHPTQNIVVGGNSSGRVHVFM